MPSNYHWSTRKRKSTRRFPVRYYPPQPPRWPLNHTLAAITMILLAVCIAIFTVIDAVQWLASRNW